jgi:hypothetical protein
MSLSADAVSIGPSSFNALRVIAADFFVPHWSLLTHDAYEQAEVASSQLAAREAVARMMESEVEYWEIDFSREQLQRVWQGFDARLHTDGGGLLAAKARKLAMALMPAESVVASADHLISTASRLASDEPFRTSVGYPQADAITLAAAIESSDAHPVELEDLYEGWKASRTEWDLRLMAQTPDFPESLATVMSSALSGNTSAALFDANLSVLIDNADERRAFIQRLQLVFHLAAPPDSQLTFPLAA